MKVSLSIFSPWRHWLAAALSVAALTVTGAGFQAVGRPKVRGPFTAGRARVSGDVARELAFFSDQSLSAHRPPQRL